MAKSALSRYFNKTREFPLNRVDDFARALDVKPEYILGLDFKKPTNLIFPDKISHIPLLGSIAAGAPITAEQNHKISHSLLLCEDLHRFWLSNR